MTLPKSESLNGEIELFSNLFCQRMVIDYGRMQRLVKPISQLFPFVNGLEKSDKDFEIRLNSAKVQRKLIQKFCLFNSSFTIP